MSLTVEYLNGVLEKKLPSHKRQLYGLSSASVNADKIVYDSPQGYWTTPDKDFPENSHSAWLPPSMLGSITDAQKYVDILTLGEYTGAFRDEVEGDLVALARSGRSVTVRFLMGAPIAVRIVTHKLLEQLADRIRLANPRASRMTVYLGQIRWEEASWNHAKIVAVDGRTIVTGGHNLWDKDYLKKDPVFDLSMRFEGQVALGGHQFADKLWDFVRARGGHGSNTYCNSLSPRLVVGRDVPPVRGPLSPAEQSDADESVGAFPALWVGAPGWGVFASPRTDESATLIALFEALKQAKTSCKMSLQDLGTKHLGVRDFTILKPDGFVHDLIGCGGSLFFLPLFNELADFLHRSPNAQIEIMLSAPHGGAHGYGHGVEFKTIFNLLSQRLNARWKVTKPAALKMLDRVHLKAVAFSNGRQKWPSGKMKDNHAKFWMLDDTLCYVGSENLYPYVESGLTPGAEQEFGIISEFPANVRDWVISKYFKPMSDYGVATKPRLEDLTW